jgi:hypothetical protein
MFFAQHLLQTSDSKHKIPSLRPLRSLRLGKRCVVAFRRAAARKRFVAPPRESDKTQT